MLLIFSLSSQVAGQSSELSGKIADIIIKVVGRITPLDIKTSNTIDLGFGLNHIVRKSAHLAVYFILSILMMNAFVVSGFNKFKAFSFTIILCSLYAVSDEVHQLFVPGRSGEVRDILIDSMGAMLGSVVYLTMSKIKMLKGEIGR